MPSRTRSCPPSARIHAFDGDAQLATWLHRIVVNAALMKLRTRRRKPEQSIEPMLPAFAEDGHHASRPVVAWTTSAEDALLRRETRAQVRAAIAELPERYRTVLLLRDIEERSTREAADLLGITENAVKLRLHRARQALATELGATAVATGTVACLSARPASGRRLRRAPPGSCHYHGRAGGEPPARRRGPRGRVTGCQPPT